MANYFPQNVGMGQQGPADSAPSGQSLSDVLSDTTRMLIDAEAMAGVIAARIEGNQPVPLANTSNPSDPKVPTLQSLGFLARDKATWLVQELARINGLI